MNNKNARGNLKMRIKVKFFAAIKEQTGLDSWEHDFLSDVTVDDIREELIKSFPTITQLLKQSVIAINMEYALPKQKINENDEVAIIPPVSGGENSELLEITYEPLNVEKIIKKVSNPYAGAIVTFLGTVREFTGEKRTTYLEYEAYQEMALKKLEQIAEEVKERWPETVIAISHRLGKMEIEDLSVVIAVATPHRTDGFLAAKYAIDRLKQIVPIWKKENWEDGSEWVGHQLGPWDPTAKYE